ncbi:MAG TPA: condensation domain-containing protein, partial [Pseudonocardiaceae bacterium]
PIDPDLPADRIEFMLQDANPVLVLDTVVDIDGPSTNPVHRLRPDNAAYVIYTSGSTGRPKGVTVEHHCLANLLACHRAGFVADTGGGRLRVALTAIFSFDTSLEGPLLMADGHELHLIDTHLRLDPDALVAYIARHRIDFLDLTPSYVRQLIPAGLLAVRPRILMLGGEPLSEPLWRELAAAEHTLSYNFYGPTETTIDALVCRVEQSSRPSVGRPLANLRAYVLDSAHQPVPIGVRGELYLAGDQLARGYLNRPGLTADRFPPNPFGPPGSRMYRPGDLVRWTNDGTLDYLGRIDDQVKVRGHRIELGEIEAALMRQPDIAEAAAAVRHTDGRDLLVGYVVPTSLAPGDLRAALRQVLPDYMVPTAFVTLDALPRTPSGKIDRRALPAPALGSSETGQVAPRTAAERQLAEIWSQVLGVARVGVADNFFGLGGDSILSIQIVSRARAAGLRLTSKDIFLHQTIADLAPLVGQVAEPVHAVEPVRGPVPLTPIQRWFFETHRDNPHHYAMSMLVELAEDVDPSTLGTALAALVDHHEALRLRFQVADEIQQDAEPTLDPATFFQCVDMPVAAAALEAQSSMDISAGPLVRALLFTGRRPLLFVTCHHLVVDGVSWRVLFEDLATAYAHLAAGEPVALPPVTTSYREWAARLSDFVGSGGLDDELAYWQDIKPATLPIDHNGPNTHPEAITTRLDRAHTEALLRMVPDAYRTQVNDVLLAALGRALSEWSGHDMVLIGMEG